MKDLNKIFYDILLKINKSERSFKINKNLVLKYFDEFNEFKYDKYELFDEYFTDFIIFVLN